MLICKSNEARFGTGFRRDESLSIWESAFAGQNPTGGTESAPRVGGAFRGFVLRRASGGPLFTHFLLVWQGTLGGFSYSIVIP